MNYVFCALRVLGNLLCQYGNYRKSVSNSAVEKLDYGNIYSFIRQNTNV